MPCYDSRDSEELENLRKLKDENARIACKCLKTLEAVGLMVNDPEVIAWWEAHKQADAEREKNDK
jgi:hypothetical protein